MSVLSVHVCRTMSYHVRQCPSSVLSYSSTQEIARKNMELSDLAETLRMREARMEKVVAYEQLIQL